MEVMGMGYTTHTMSPCQGRGTPAPNPTRPAPGSCHQAGPDCPQNAAVAAPEGFRTPPVFPWGLAGL